MTIEFHDFKVDIPPEEVDRLRRKLQDTRLPAREIVPDAGDRSGPRYAWAQTMLAKWTSSSFDWAAIQHQLNQHPHYLAKINDDLKIHFLHARADSPNAIPLLLIHGWPGSFYEFSRVWGPLSHPDTEKDANEQPQPFHVVVPSLPGFCWSDGPPRAGWTLQDTAGVFDSLMRGLGYDEYMVQGGDWGHFVARELGARYSGSCKLVHFNFAPGEVPEGVERSEREEAVAGRVGDWVENHLGYAVCMRTRPHTIGIALHDNPLGILMWIGEKYLEASDPEKQKDASWADAILTTASLYYFTGCMMPSMLCYFENVRHEDFARFTLDPRNRVAVPFGYSSFFWDTEPSSKRAVERTGNLVYYKEHNDGGHFAALENPEDIIQDVRELAAQEWRS